jgi:hypothetical protein
MDHRRMLFLLRPRQTYMPYALPRDPKQMATRNRMSRDAYASTRQAAPYAPESAPSGTDVVALVKDLAEMHKGGSLTDAEFAAAKAKVLGTDGGAS